MDKTRHVLLGSGKAAKWMGFDARPGSEYTVELKGPRGAPGSVEILRGLETISDAERVVLSTTDEDSAEFRAAAASAHSVRREILRRKGLPERVWAK